MFDHHDIYALDAAAAPPPSGDVANLRGVYAYPSVPISRAMVDADVCSSGG